MEGEPVLPDSPELRRHLVERLGHEREERLLVIYLTEDRLYLAQDEYLCGHRTRIVLPTRAPVRRAFDLDARRVILAHNHPSGDSQPSREDVAATRTFRDLVEMLEIHLDDHFVVSGDRLSSMRDARLM